MKQLIGRHKEKEMLEKCYNSGKSEFVIVSGRRRIGKTYLVNALYEKKFAFAYVGGHHLTKEQQLHRFATALKEYSKTPIDLCFRNWFEAFDGLKSFLLSLGKKKRLIVFFDEMPWIDSRKSDFVKALESFWNSWGAQKDNLMLIASGSATSWLNDNLVENQGGLHGRITRNIILQPFTLSETEEYLNHMGAKWDRYQIAQTYMVFGGVPFYLSLLDKTLSLAQNIDELFFSAHASMAHEFDELFAALFTNSELYIKVIKQLAEKRKGLLRNEIIASTQLQGSTLTKILRNLEKSNFIVSYNQFGKKSKDSIYKLADFYTLFYLKFIDSNKTKDKKWWTNHINTPELYTWQGFSFELLCLLHLDQLKNALGISGIATEASEWRSNDSQIDLVIERSDRMINLCEMKFSKDPYEITKEYADKLRERRSDFSSSTKTKKSIITTFVTTYGIKKGKHSSVAEQEITLDDLF